MDVLASSSRSALMTLGLLFALYLFLWFLQKKPHHMKRFSFLFQKKNELDLPHRLKLIQQISLAPRREAYLFEVEGQLFMCVCTEVGVSPLTPVHVEKELQSFSQK